MRRKTDLFPPRPDPLWRDAPRINGRPDLCCSNPTPEKSRMPPQSHCKQLAVSTDLNRHHRKAFGGIIGSPDFMGKPNPRREQEQIGKLHTTIFPSPT